MRKVKYFTRDTLIEANKVAVRTKRNHSLYEEPLLALPDDLKFPVGFTMPHNDVEIRVSLTVGLDINKPESWGNVWLDIPFDTYNSLPEAEVPE